MVLTDFELYKGVQDSKKGSTYVEKGKKMIVLSDLVVCKVIRIEEIAKHGGFPLYRATIQSLSTRKELTGVSYFSHREMVVPTVGEIGVFTAAKRLKDERVFLTLCSKNNLK